MKIAVIGAGYFLYSLFRGGTAVNRRFLDPGGEQVLRDGDELTLGHHAASMAFRVQIQ